MKERHFMIVLAVTLALCIAVTVSHVVYDIQAYENGSIIYFIAKELW